MGAKHRVAAFRGAYAPWYSIGAFCRNEFLNGSGKVVSARARRFPRELICIGLTGILGSLSYDTSGLSVYGLKRNNWRDSEPKGFGDLFYCTGRNGFRS